MGLLSVLLADLTNLAAESRKRFPAIKEVPKDIMLFLAIFIENRMDVNCKFIFFSIIENARRMESEAESAPLTQFLDYSAPSYISHDTIAGS